MEGLLDSSRGNHVCNSVQDIQDILHNLLTARSSDTRADHASITFELRYYTVFHLNADAENGPADGVVDPAQPQQQPITRSVNASETIQNQPSDDPVLQRAVAKHIIGAMGIIDSSSWTVRQVSREAQGWTFTYICKDSLQAWNRANAKNAEKPAIGSYSGPGGLDPTHLSRPAFDCRGTLTIAFSKSARAVLVKYNHTPIHKSVAQLVDLLAPALPPPPPVNNSKTSNQRTPRAKRPPPTEGGEGSRKKRQRKSRGKAPEAPMGTPMLGDIANLEENAESQNADLSGLHLTSILNVPEEEAERRRQTAINLLNGKGVDPATLSAEQFNIFANQAPNLQEASLEMLAKYGAERLRIVHPDDKEQPESTSSTPAEKQSANATPITGPGPTSTPGTNETPIKRRRSRKKKSDGPAAEVSIGDGAVVSVEQSGEVGTTASTLKPTGKKTRGACAICRERKLKCTKEHPSCSVCIAASRECIYLPPKPRRKRSGVSGDVVENEDSDLPGEREQFQMQNHAEEVDHMSEAPVSVPPSAPSVAPPPDSDNEDFIPDPNILAGPAENQPATTQPSTTRFYQGNNTMFPYPSTSQSSSGHASMTAFAYPESQLPQSTHDEASSGLTFPSASHQTDHSPGLAFSQPALAASQRASQRKRSTSNRRSLPTTQAKQTPIPIPTPVPAPVIPPQTSNWNASPTTAHATTASPKRSRSRKSGVESTQYVQDGMKQAAALSQTAMQRQSQPSSATGSPYQNAARTISRQGHRSQTNTPVASTSRPPPQAPRATTNASYNTTSSSSVPNYESYTRYDNSTTSQYNNTTSDQGSTRIAYEPGSYHPTTMATTTSGSYSSTPAYDYSQGTGTARSANPLSQALNSSTGYTNTTNAAATQWPTSQTRGTQQRAQPHTTSPYAMPSTTATTSAAHSYGTRSADARTQHQNASYNQPQSQPYGSYSTQQPNTSQQTQQQNWYGFNAANNSSSSSSSTNQNNYSSNRNSGYSGAANPNHTTSYSAHRANAPNFSGHGYGAGSDDQYLHDLLRASGSTH